MDLRDKNSEYDQEIPVFGVSDKATINQSPQLQRLARILKFRS